MADHHPREYQWATEPTGSIVRDPLHEVMVMRVSPAVSPVPVPICRAC